MFSLLSEHLRNSLNKFARSNFSIHRAFLPIIKNIVDEGKFIPPNFSFFKYIIYIYDLLMELSKWVQSCFEKNLHLKVQPYHGREKSSIVPFDFPFQRYRIAPSKFTRLLRSARSSVYFILTTILPCTYRVIERIWTKMFRKITDYLECEKSKIFFFQNCCAKRRRSQRFNAWESTRFFEFIIRGCGEKLVMS